MKKKDRREEGRRERKKGREKGRKILSGYCILNLVINDEEKQLSQIA